MTPPPEWAAFPVISDEVMVVETDVFTPPPLIVAELFAIKQDVMVSVLNEVEPRRQEIPPPESAEAMFSVITVERRKHALPVPL
jgi:hypothetical protein